MSTETTTPARETITATYVVRVKADLSTRNHDDKPRENLTRDLGLSIADTVTHEMPYECPEEGDLVQEVHYVTASHLDELNATDARTLLDQLAARLGLTVTKAPEVREAIIVKPETEDEQPHMQCPHCNEQDCMAEVDKSVRQNDLVNLDYGMGDKRADLYVDVSEGDTDYETDHYECTACGGHVTIPVEVEIVWG
jgi:hypothetical protein